MEHRPSAQALALPFVALENALGRLSERAVHANMLCTTFFMLLGFMIHDDELVYKLEGRSHFSASGRIMTMMTVRLWQVDARDDARLVRLEIDRGASMIDRHGTSHELDWTLYSHPLFFWHSSSGKIHKVHSLAQPPPLPPPRSACVRYPCSICNRQ